MPTNTPIDILDIIINDVLKGVGLKEAYALIIAAIPFLGWGPIGWVTMWLVTWIGSKVLAAFEKFAAFKIIDFQTIEENANYQATVAQLKAAQVTNDQAQIDAATIAFKKTLGNLIHFDGS